MKSGGRRARLVWMALVLCSQALAADGPALIRNRVFIVGGGKEVDAAVRVVAVDALPVVDNQSEVYVAPGPHVIEILCTARVLAGMGTVDFPSKSDLAVGLESGRSYQLDASVTVRGDCTPGLQ